MGLRHLAPDVRHHHGVPGPGDVRSHRPIHVAEPDETDAAHGVIRPVFVRNSLWPWEKRSISASSRSCMATSMAPSRNFNPASSDRAAGAVAVLDRVREPARGEGVAHHADIVDATGAQRLGPGSLGLLRPDPDSRGRAGNRLLTSGVAVLQHDGALLDATDVRVRTGGDALLVEGPQRRDARDSGQLTEDLEEPRDHGHLLAL